MYTGLLHTHSLFRWIALILLIAATAKSFSGWLGKKSYTAADNKLSLFAMISVHIQLVLGLLLYFISDWVSTGLADFGGAMKEPALRFWTVEHSLGMIIAIALITVGRVSSKKAADDLAKHKKTALYFMFGLLIMLLSIPWPFSTVSRPLF